MNPTVNTRGWRDRLEEAITDKLELDSEEHGELCRLAGQWSYCAVGENFQALKEKGYQFENNEPGMGNPEVDKLGMDFYDAVIDGHWANALEILNKIENLPTLEEKENV